MSPACRSLVSGAAGAIGSSVVDVLLKRRHEVVGIDVDPRVLSLSDSSRYAGIQARLGDLHEMPAVPALGPCTHAFLVAGGALAEEVADAVKPGSRDFVRLTVENNFVSAIDGIAIMRSSYVFPSRGIGSITLVSSINAMRPFGLPIYSASKAALAGLVTSMAAGLASEGIRLNSVALGTVAHPEVEELHRAEADHFERLRERAPIGRLMTPGDAARAIVTLGLDVSFLVGQTVIVDGGQSLIALE